MTSAGIPEISFLDLGIVVILMGVVCILTIVLKLGLAKKVVISTIRAFVQLLALGFVLRWIFINQTWWMVLLAAFVMLIAATQIAVTRTNNAPKKLYPYVFITLLISATVMVGLVVEVIIGAKPWFDARIMLPIIGMILGNAMTATAVAIDRLFSDMDARSDEIFAMTALGASPRESAWNSMKAAIAAGLTPTLASLSATGIVSIPGMMSGQVIAGADPLLAAKYQIVISTAISALTLLVDVIVVFLVYKKRFSKDCYFIDPTLRDVTEQETI